MRFFSVLYAFLSLTTLVSSLPAPSPASDLMVKSDLVERQPDSLAPVERGVVDLVADVQVCIDACIAINQKYAARKSYTRSACQSWSTEIIAKIQILIETISAYPDNCTYPSIDVCVSIFIKLFVCIFVQLKAFIDLGGLIFGLLSTVEILLGCLLGLVGDLLNIIISLCLLIEVKIKVGICASIISGCGGLIGSLYISVLVKLLANVGIPC
ncbi:hypothetical protein TWF694_001829 [Orbilia ellipsospora]|uniref:Transmembrane protein n=1 Tax=Orbilia ellipsospora TaxID=2528407 RepID=A0AAV9X4Y3_9PEZI